MLRKRYKTRTALETDESNFTLLVILDIETLKFDKKKLKSKTNKIYRNLKDLKKLGN